MFLARRRRKVSDVAQVQQRCICLRAVHAEVHHVHACCASQTTLSLRA